MDIKITSNIQFSVTSIQYAPNGVLCISLSSGETTGDSRYQYSACLGDGQAEEKPTLSLLRYAREYAASANIKPKTRDTYRLMCNHLETKMSFQKKCVSLQFENQL